MSNLEERMSKSLSVFEENLSEIRAGRANPAILNKITVEYYGVATPINQVAGISVPEARTIVISPWDASILKDVEKAILASDIGLNPNNRVSIRSIRRDGMEEVKTKQKNGEMTEDDKAREEENIQKLTDKYIENIDKALENKEKEVMSI